MIRYNLVCEAGHEFDGWFRSSADFDTQAEAGDLACAVCGTRGVSKALMTPGVPSKSGRDRAPERPQLAAPANAKAAELMRQMRTLRDKLLENSEYVGEKFAEEARRIHYGEADHRGIHGEASLDDARQLKDEGIDVFALPVLPDDKN